MTRHLASLLVALLLAAAPAARGADQWPTWGGDPGGRRHSAADQITPANVASLVPAWTWRHGDLPDGAARRSVAFAATPLHVDDALVLCTPTNRVVALDPGTGEERWSHDPGVDRSFAWPLKLACRGVASWRDPTRPGGTHCAHRIFAPVVDARLIALDARSGRPCLDFGEAGTLRLAPADPAIPGEFSLTSPPAVVGDVVVVGSGIADNVRAQAPAGNVRAFDARSGAARWTLPTLREGTAAGAANVWSVASVDAARDLVFLPVGSASPDHWGGNRPGDGWLANAVVAVRGRTGEIAWRFQTVHHGLWDYDLAAQPMLTTLPGGRDVVVQGTKSGFVFVLDRETGAPVFGVEERAVPPSRARGETAWPTQPFPLAPPPLVPQRLDPDDAWGPTPADRAACRERIAALRSEGLYTPPDPGGSVLFPSNLGGVHWGSGAIDPDGPRLVVPTNRFAHALTLLDDWSPRWFVAALRSRTSGWEGLLTGFGRVPGAPYGFLREELRSPSGLPCNPPPWGALSAVDLARGVILWEVPLGETQGLAGSGAVNLGGPVATASGLVFIAAAADGHLRAFALRDGAELWRTKLPAPGQATPMTYVHEGRQYVVIAAGGSTWLDTPLGDHLVAFALPD